MSFEQWMRLVDVYVGRLVAGLTHDDLPDCCYHDWYDDNMSAKVAARKAVSAAKE